MFAKVILVAALAAVSLALPAPYYGGQVEKYAPVPINFGYETNDNYGTTTFRKETGNGAGQVRGAYGYKDLNGVERVVEYVADEHGYRAEIKTNEPGTESQNPADVLLHANPLVLDQPKYAAPRSLYQAAPAYPRY